MRPHAPDPLPPCGRPRGGRHEIHIAFLKGLVGLQCLSRPKAEIRLYDFNLFKTVLYNRY